MEMLDERQVKKGYMYSVHLTQKVNTEEYELTIFAKTNNLSTAHKKYNESISYFKHIVERGIWKEAKNGDSFLRSKALGWTIFKRRII